MFANVASKMSRPVGAVFATTAHASNMDVAMNRVVSATRYVTHVGVMNPRVIVINRSHRRVKFPLVTVERRWIYGRTP